MEMDELKKIWDEGTDRPRTGGDIFEMIRTDKNGPLATLEKRTWIAIWIFPFAGVLFAGAFFDYLLARQSLAMWLLFLILFAEFVFSVFNLITIKRMRNAQGSIRENLLARIRMLGQRFQQFLKIYMSLYLLMAVLLELTIHNHLDSLFEGWAHVPFLIRVVTYAIVLIVIYHSKRSSQHEHFGTYLQQLKTIVEQTN